MQKKQIVELTNRPLKTLPKQKERFPTINYYNIGD